jgi:hypothetical protein
MIKRIITAVFLIFNTIGLFAFDGYVFIKNETGLPLYMVNISPHGEDSWGNDLLSSEDIIDNGETYRFIVEDMPGSIFDIKVEDVDGDIYIMDAVDLAETQEVTFLPEHMSAEDSESLGEITLVGSGGPVNRTYFIYNNTSKDILYIYIRRHSEDSDNKNDWSQDILGEKEILTSKGLLKIIAKDLPDEKIDIRFEDKRGHTYTFSNLDLKILKDLTISKDNRDAED